MLMAGLFDGANLMMISLLLTSGLLFLFMIMAIRLRSYFIGTVSELSNSAIRKFTLSGGGGGGGSSGGTTTAVASGSSGGGSGGNGGSGGGSAGGSVTGAVAGVNSTIRSVSGGKANLGKVALAGLAGAGATSAVGEFVGRSGDESSSSSAEDHALINDYDVAGDQETTDVDQSESGSVDKKVGYQGNVVSSEDDLQEREKGRSLMEAASLASVSGRKDVSSGEDVLDETDGAVAFGSTGTQGQTGNGMDAVRGVSAQADVHSERGVHADVESAEPSVASVASRDVDSERMDRSAEMDAADASVQKGVSVAESDKKTSDSSKNVSAVESSKTLSLDSSRGVSSEAKGVSLGEVAGYQKNVSKSLSSDGTRGVSAVVSDAQGRDGRVSGQIVGSADSQSKYSSDAKNVSAYRSEVAAGQAGVSGHDVRGVSASDSAKTAVGINDKNGSVSEFTSGSSLNNRNVSASEFRSGSYGDRSVSASEVASGSSLNNRSVSASESSLDRRSDSAVGMNGKDGRGVVAAEFRSGSYGDRSVSASEATFGSSLNNRSVLASESSLNRRSDSAVGMNGKDGRGVAAAGSQNTDRYRSDAMAGRAGTNSSGITGRDMRSVVAAGSQNAAQYRRDSAMGKVGSAGSQGVGRGVSISRDGAGFYRASAEAGKAGTAHAGAVGYGANGSSGTNMRDVSAEHSGFARDSVYGAGVSAGSLSHSSDDRSFASYAGGAGMTGRVGASGSSGGAGVSGSIGGAGASGSVGRTDGVSAGGGVGRTGASGNDGDSFVYRNASTGSASVVRGVNGTTGAVGRSGDTVVNHTTMQPQNRPEEKNKKRPESKNTAKAAPRGVYRANGDNADPGHIRGVQLGEDTRGMSFDESLNRSFGENTSEDV